ncbi:MAG: 4-hydroxy-3-methylbut-2-enyl diphosphate reductase [Opitutales bacterium]
MASPLPAESLTAPVDHWALLVFSPDNRALLHRGEDGCLTVTARLRLPEPGTPDAVPSALVAALPNDWPLGKARPQAMFAPSGAPGCAFAFLRLDEDPPAPDAAWEVWSIESLRTLARDQPGAVDDLLKAALPDLSAHAIEIPYLNFKRHDFVYKFRSERERNTQVYAIDDASAALYQSQLCQAIKAVRRQKENSASPPAHLDFGAVQYLLPSHFGFCLGVQNAIERAYETLAEHPGRRVFMLSELIHNPFVNEDLRARGLRYLQTDKGVPVEDPGTGRPYWEDLTAEDVVIIPAFGATDADKRRLIEKGMPINRYDATCMLVEKVWKAAKRFGEGGHTVIIHGKAEHEETKATFSNSARYAPSLIIRDIRDAERLAAILKTADPTEKRARLDRDFAGKVTPGFDPVRDLDRIAVVNQTTLLRNETLKIINFLEGVMAEIHGAENVADHVAGKSRGDTLCYATQVNQDALQQCLAEPLDLAIVAGGKNSSNTFQLYRMCADRLGDRAFYVQSEGNIHNAHHADHYIFPYNPEDPKQGALETRPFLPEPLPERPLRILLTGGASCPDGIIQQIITRINGFFPENRLRPIETVIAEVEAGA